MVPIPVTFPDGTATPLAGLMETLLERFDPNLIGLDGSTATALAHAAVGRTPESIPVERATIPYDRRNDPM